MCQFIMGNLSWRCSKNVANAGTKRNFNRVEYLAERVIPGLVKIIVAVNEMSNVIDFHVARFSCHQIEVPYNTSRIRRK